MALSFQNLHNHPIIITLITTLSLLFFTLTTPPSSPHKPPLQRTLLSTPQTPPCSIFSPIIGGFLNYFSLHFCTFNTNPLHSIPLLTLLLILHFYILIKTAQTHFIFVVTKLTSVLSLNPSMGAVTLLALGNGAPDVFASVAAVAGGNSRTGFGAILSAGTFVSGFVVGVVGINAGPFGVDSTSFVRDVMFYLMGGLMLFYVYLSGELYFWQALGFVGFYLFFVGFVFWMDFGSVSNKIGDFEKQVDSSVQSLDCEKGDRFDASYNSGFFNAFNKISKIWEAPVSILLKLTIPQTSPTEWSRFYMSANIALCPLALLYSCKQFIPMDHPVIFLIPQMHLPLWLVLLFSSSSLAILHYIVEKEPPKTEKIHVVLVSFVMSVFWISNVAGELLNCLAALGKILNLPPAILGLTVLAWGNSVGDLVADVALAKAGQPALAMAGCFAGPMFNMLVGLGTALVIQTAKVYPEPYVLHFHISIVVAFVFLFLSLMGSLLVVTWSRFRVPKFWGYCLVGLYVCFIFVSLIIAKFST